VRWKWGGREDLDVLEFMDGLEFGAQPSGRGSKAIHSQKHAPGIAH